MRTLRDRTRYLLRQLLALRRLRQTHGLRTRRGEEWGDRRDRAQVAFDVPSRRGAGRRARAPHHCQWLGVCRFGHVASLRLWDESEIKLYTVPSTGFIHHDLLTAACWGDTGGTATSIIVCSRYDGTMRDETTVCACGCATAGRLRTRENTKSKNLTRRSGTVVCTRLSLRTCASTSFISSCWPARPASARRGIGRRVAGASSHARAQICERPKSVSRSVLLF